MSHKLTPKFIQECIKHHNDYRVIHGSPPLVEDTKLNQFAQEWAENLAKRDLMQHRVDNPYGENIFQAYNSDPNWVMMPIDPVKAWYEEISLYKFGEAKPKNPSAVGHFTQLVWKETEKVGVGMATSGRGYVYIVCNYDPPGNVIGQFAKNVVPAKKSSKEIDEERQERERRWQEREERRKKRGDKIALTPSLEKIGIKFVQPNMEVIEAMDRLIAVPSEKFRAWSCWLSLVGDEVHEWRHWLLSQIDLVLRMNEIMMEIESKKKKSKEDKQTVQQATETDDGNQIDTKRGSDKEEEKVEEEKVEGTKDEEATIEEENLEFVELDDKIETEFLDETLKPEESSLDNESTSDANDVGEDSEEKIETGEGTDGKVTNEIEKEGDADILKGEENKEKGNVWPIGRPWEPKESDKKQEHEKPKLEKVKIIPIPRNKEEMMKLILDVRHKATIYRSLYQHWIETGDRAKGELLGRDVMKTDLVYTHEDIPYFFYLKCEPDIAHDDEQILLPDLTRERISSNYINLFYNLADKPGKGGKPWI